MKYAQFNDPKEIRINGHIFHDAIVTEINVVKEDDGYVICDNGEVLDSSPCYPEKGSFYATRINNRWYKAQDTIGFDEDRDVGPWFENPWYYDNRFVVYLEDGDEKYFVKDKHGIVYPYTK